MVIPYEKRQQASVRCLSALGGFQLFDLGFLALNKAFLRIQIQLVQHPLNLQLGVFLRQALYLEVLESVQTQRKGNDQGDHDRRIQMKGELFQCYVLNRSQE